MARSLPAPEAAGTSVSTRSRRVWTSEIVIGFDRVMAVDARSRSASIGGSDDGSLARTTPIPTSARTTIAAVIAIRRVRERRAMGPL